MKPPDIGKCIYCGAAENLTTEHIIPYGLNGKRVLLRASCRACARITSSFEREVLRETLSGIRAVLNIRSRKKKNKLRPLFVKMERNGRDFMQEVPADDYIPLIPALYAEPPTYIKTCRRHQTGEGSQNVQVVGKVIYRTNTQIDELLAKYNVSKIKPTFTFNPTDFGRMLAKIAYCFAVERFGLNGITDNYVLPAILDEADGDLWHFVGCDYNYSKEDKRPARKGALNKQNALIWGDLTVVDGDIFVWIRLFPLYDYPVYMLVVGRASEALRGVLHCAGWKLA